MLTEAVNKFSADGKFLPFSSLMSICDCSLYTTNIATVSVMYRVLQYFVLLKVCVCPLRTLVTA